MARRTPPIPTDLADLFKSPEKIRAIWGVVLALENLEIIVVKGGVRKRYPIKLGEVNGVFEINVD